MELDLKGHAALIAGDPPGIGYGVARLLVAESCNLHLAPPPTAAISISSPIMPASYRKRRDHRI